MPEILPVDYIPSESEEYMNPMQLLYFEKILLDMRSRILSSSSRSNDIMARTTGYQADMTDNASLDAETYTESKTQYMQYGSLVAINNSLKSIKDGDYGYCNASGKKIGLRRLMANPTATLCIEEQEKYEKIRTSYANNNDDDIMIGHD